MESFEIKNLSFSYPNRENRALDGISLTVNAGEFVTVCGKSGCGKTTLLRLLKSSLAPFGKTDGEIYFFGKPLADTDAAEQASKIGFVMQSPDNQIVTDKVWHELAFGLESLGVPTQEIRVRVSEMASFFGIQTWFHKNVTELSGGQKQLLNLASVMVMQPSVLILDEPTSQLDPIAAQEFIKTLERINRELGTTVILSEHRLEEALSVSDRVIVMDSGKILADTTPDKVGKELFAKNHSMYLALPAPIKVYGAVENTLTCPVSVREGKVWLEKISESHPLHPELIPTVQNGNGSDDTVIEAKDVYFRYEKNLPDVIKGLNIKINKGELFTIVGGNGTGKTTALSLFSGLHKPYRGKILINGRDITKTENLYSGTLGVLPQNPQTLFVKKTVYLDLMEMLSGTKLTNLEKELRVKNMAALCRIDTLLESHPYDLSGGEQQRAALAKVLLMSPRILLLDEPTKGLDAHFKTLFADILGKLQKDGVTIVMVSHDIEFCAEYADRCALVFDGSITCQGEPRGFFAGKSFYTTSANRMARTKLPAAILANDIILALGGKVPGFETELPDVSIYADTQTPKAENPPKAAKAKLAPQRITAGAIFAFLFVLTSVLLIDDIPLAQFLADFPLRTETVGIISIAELALALFCFFPGKTIGTKELYPPQSDRKLTTRTLISALLILLAIPLTILLGVYLLDDRKYYFISLLIILETILPFCIVFENRKPKARELVIISVLCAIAVAGRAAFFMLPQFKPVLAIVIIAGVCFGGETGFLVGAVTGFVSNFLFGQGVWTPWQMFALGIIGFIAGVLFRKGLIRRTKAALCIFGAVCALVIYGGIMNPASVIMSQDNINAEMIISAYLMGLPFDAIHAASTAFFLWFIAEPMIEKLERIKIKYGLIER